ncbi:ABC transporter permease [Actinotalea sp. M2MS4P-6]|uniref:ABC transporter permease n=1 Tax=Actinotalea sp. M2MS4P-6 TaxID=2983762 RepID=UPI0021E3C8D1|nr:ABC transporter permease [Actinotalea sp. M2MS4P-6]MCV2392889.1 ABC transporter permease [Actinotalea sp. M2MS4P-6]
MTTTLTRPVSTVAFPRLALVHYRYGFLETVRVPMAVLGTMLFPALALLFFVVPQRAVAGDPLAAAAATAQLAVFAVMSTSVFTYGIGVAEDRAQPFDPYLRTLPAGPWPRMVGRVLNGTTWSLLGLVPPILVAVLLTEASIPFDRFLLSVLLVMLAGIPFLLIGLTIGYLMSSKAATAVAQVVVFPLAFAGGLFLPPETFPGWLDTLSTFLPSRAARDLVVSAATGADLPATALPVLLGWTVAFALLTAYAYRRDEGRRFH